MDPKVTNIIKNTFLMSLGTNTEQGIWVSDVIHVSDGISPAIYWISSPDAKHSKALLSNPECAVSITQTTKTNEPKLGIQMQGFAHEVQGDTYHLTCLHAEKQGQPKPINTASYCGDDVWYVFFPYLTEIFDEKQEHKEKIDLLSKVQISEFKKSLEINGYPFTFLWFDMPNHEYASHKHTFPVQFHILYGGVTFTHSDGSLETVSKGETHTEMKGAIHSAKTDNKGCIYLVGQINSSEPSVDL